ncbi:Pimeloyl-ACP methyl ester carboxylesterase [Variovorax sp. YR634]|uniref:alpha/beta fold hydrolase n=1 Tax=unclassified Variovorax TaxID=663243 RepID=UPI00089CF9AE|nr:MULTISPECIES: alpha/beta hydrolase [unclassified Variovorax]SDY13308.1 Pimeloyl-ACP methyl ester carboxylesterase [Variovorax sp. YR634]SDZ32038.1 Pimeloyl-ACP methyl ester carboxylesterase [Variovorax sp. YR266]
MRRDNYPHQDDFVFMTEPTLHYVACDDAQGGHRMAYWQWGDARSTHVVICVHGLTRQGRDFDRLAQAIVARAGGNVRVVCPDVVGRGRSDWLRDPAFYQVPVYAADMVALIAQLHREQAIDTLDYLGTSMGGLIGFVLAGHKELPLARPIRRFIANDVGPTIEPAAVQRIGAYVGKNGSYESVQAAADAMWVLSTTFGPHTPAQWLALSQHMVVPASQRTADGSAKVEAGSDDEGSWLLHYDPAIGVALRAITPEAAAQGGAIMWSLYDAIEARTLITRGAVSDLLSRETALAMTQRGPHAKLVEFEGVGHAPTFVDPAQIAAVTDFLFD